MSTKELLLELTAKYAELVVLVKKLIATKVEDVTTISTLQNDLNAKNQEVANLLSSDAEAAALASGLSTSIAELITEATNAIPVEPSEPVEETTPEVPVEPSEPVEEI